jgi:hypothetical protein
MITQERLKSLFEYNNTTGRLVALSNSKRRKVGDLIGNRNERGYLVASVDGKNYRVHRLVFLYHFGYMPEQIDHINGVRDDNRIENLREATSIQNSYNRKPLAQSGKKGVYWHKQSQKWVASIWINKKNIHLGSFCSVEEAALVAFKTREKKHGDFAYIRGDR